jgi:hypothetical protein
MKPPKSDSVYSLLPLLSRRAICEHYCAARDRLRDIEKSFIKLVRQRIESSSDDDVRANAFWECFDGVLPVLSKLTEDTLKSYREILMAHIEGSPSVGEEDVQRLIAALAATGTEIIGQTISRHTGRPFHADSLRHDHLHPAGRRFVSRISVGMPSSTLTGLSSATRELRLVCSRS